MACANHFSPAFGRNIHCECVASVRGFKLMYIDYIWVNAKWYFYFREHGSVEQIGQTSCAKLELMAKVG
jgi:hypothetical protein